MFVTDTRYAAGMQQADLQTFYSELGTLVRRRRDALGHTQAELAANLRLSRASIANIETGRQKVLLHQLFQLAGALQLEVTDLLPQRLKASRTHRVDEALPFPEGLSTEQKVQLSRLLGTTTARVRLKLAKGKGVGSKT